MNVEKNMVWDNFHGMINQNMQEILQKTIYKDKELINGQMEEFIQVNGMRTKCMDLVYSHGVMAKNMKENMSMIKKKVMEYSLGQMGNNIEDIGKTVNNMVKDVQQLMARQHMEHGKKAKE